MINRQEHPMRPLPVANYSAAIAKAVEWLGDRYLLAKPINPVHSADSAPVTPTVSRVRLRSVA